MPVPTAEQDTLESTTTVTVPVTDDGDHDRFAHYVDKSKIPEAELLGVPIRALCGKVWVPKYDPERFPVCPDCKAAYEKLSD